MLLLCLYALTALGFSFLCSIAEAVILSVTSAHIALLEQNKKASAPLLRKLKSDIERPLAAILTLNTIAHTVGAAGVGAQASVVFGNTSLAITSGILTLLILVFSEIIPKTLGAHYWRQLAPSTAYGLHWLIRLLYPFVKLSELLTQRFTETRKLHGLNREEFSVMADVSLREGQLDRQESEMLKNILRLHKVRVRDVMTPRSVMFTANENLAIREFLDFQKPHHFSRIPVYQNDAEQIEGFVLRSDLLAAYAKGQEQDKLKNFKREMKVTLETLSLSRALDEFIRTKAHILLVVSEYGDVEGIITLEDVFETLLGLEIMDESDSVDDMQKLARKLWKHRAQQLGIDPVGMDSQVSDS